MARNKKYNWKVDHFTRALAPSLKFMNVKWNKIVQFRWTGIAYCSLFLSWKHTSFCIRLILWTNYKDLNRVYCYCPSSDEETDGDWKMPSKKTLRTCKTFIYIQKLFLYAKAFQIFRRGKRWFKRGDRWQSEYIIYCA